MYDSYFLMGGFMFIFIISSLMAKIVVLISFLGYLSRVWHLIGYLLLRNKPSQHLEATNSTSLLAHDSVGQQHVQSSFVMSGVCPTGYWLNSFKPLQSIGTSAGDWMVLSVFMYMSDSWLGLLVEVYLFSATSLGWLSQVSLCSSHRAARGWEKKMQGLLRCRLQSCMMSLLSHFL